ncbi:MAG: transposase [Patescibacteria group bacterium]
MEIYHTLNRGVDKREIFMDDQDRFRFVHDLYAFNDADLINANYWDFKKANDSGFNVIARRSIEKKRRKMLVNIHAFCLMPNHYHLLLSPKIEGGIPKFMKKLNMGYARYFNERYKRKGALFEGRYKSIPVMNDKHFGFIPQYIHFNPLDLVSPEWRENRLVDCQKAINFLGSYRWSSYLDYIGKKNFPSVTNRRFILDCLGGTEQYKSNTKKYLEELDIKSLGKSTLEF